MSLLYWLPLNGNSNNQGVMGDIPTIVGTGITYNAGKIGLAATFPNNCSSYITLPPLNLQTGSFCAWIKVLGEGSGNSYQYVISEGRDSNTIGTNIRLTKAGTSLAFVTHGKTINVTVELNEWFHIACTFADGNIAVYKNGVLTGSTTYTADTDYSQSSNMLVLGKMSYSYTQTANYFPFNGQLNDVRIYNHALSPKEVEEISKGLVLHYKLNGNCFGNPNILLNTSFSSLYNQTTGWDTAKNGTILANSWGGYNGGVTNASTVYHAHLKQFNGEYVYEYIRTADESWLGISQGGLQSKLTAGKIYTFSWEQYCVSGVNHVGTGLYYFKTEATSANFHLGIQQGNVNKELGKWQKFTYTFTAPSDADYAKNMSWYIYGHYGGQGTMYVRRPKLEEGSVATMWMPALSENSLNNNIIYDSSGYNNNAISNGNIALEYSNDTPRYNISTAFTSGARIATPVSASTFMPTDAITVNIWFKSLNAANRFISCTEGGGFNFESNSGNIRFVSYVASQGYAYANSTTSWSSVSDNKWHMLTGINDKSTIKIYLDGQLIQETASQYPNSILGYAGSTPFTLGAEAQTIASPIAGTYVGNLSDIRIYATALTTAQIKELYNTSMSIDSSGNIHVREVFEL